MVLKARNKNQIKRHLPSITPASSLLLWFFFDFRFNHYQNNLCIYLKVDKVAGEVRANKRLVTSSVILDIALLYYKRWKYNIKLISVPEIPKQSMTMEAEEM